MAQLLDEWSFPLTSDRIRVRIQSLAICFFYGPSPVSFSFIFGLFQTNNTTNQCEKCPSSIPCWDSNSRPSQCESLPITTRPGFRPFISDLLIEYYLCNVNCWKDKNKEKEGGNDPLLPRVKLVDLKTEQAVQLQNTSKLVHTILEKKSQIRVLYFIYKSGIELNAFLCDAFTGEKEEWMSVGCSDLATLAKFKKPLANFDGLLEYRAKFWTYFGILCMLLGQSSFL